MTDKHSYPNLFILLVASVMYFLVLLILGSDLSLFPIDETRYMSVAWEMWQNGDYLVPHLNGDPYHHKPPLLFWLINLSWGIFGVSQWAALLIPATISVISIGLLIPISRLLWRKTHISTMLVIWLLASSLFWMIWSTIIAFDLLLAVSVEVAILGILLSWRGKPVSGWALTGLGIGLGVLAKGPVILIFVLPISLFAPLWMKEQRPSSWWRWFGGLACAVMLGTAVGLAWALPAAYSGGEEYRNAILWNQTAGRVVNSFAHARPVWWYLRILPLLLYPWILLRPLWRMLWKRRKEGFDSGERFVFLLTGSALVIFSLISGKQIHYLVPLLPPLALLTGRLLGAEPKIQLKPMDRVLVLAPVLLLGLIVAVVPFLGLPEKYSWVHTLSPLWGLMIVVGGVLFIPSVKISNRFTEHPVAWPGLVSLILFIAMYAGIVKQVSRHYDITHIAHLISSMRDTRPVAFVGDTYNGEFNFIARMDEPIAAVKPKDRLQWIDSNPDGLIVERLNKAPPKDTAGVLDVAPYKRSFLVLHDSRLPVHDYR